MDYNAIRNARASEIDSTPLDKLPKEKNLDKFRGCLIGGAAGDALGYPIEFMSEAFIEMKFGDAGLTEYWPANRPARISDDTQMTMFTANGLLFGTTIGCTRGIMGPYSSYIAGAYKDWYKTQIEPYAHCNRKFITSWLMNVPEMFATRGPGNCCMTSIDAGCYGTIEKPISNGKGCGGVMRVSPIGLYFGESRMAPLAIDLLGADTAALTHGHKMGYIPAAMLVHIVRLVSHNNEIALKDAVLDSKIAMEMLFSEMQELPGFLKLIDKAIALAESDIGDQDAIHKLGEGWVGDEALAIAVYCALRHSDNFDKALIAAVNHDGDSDSTGAITGNILGAYLGLSQIPAKYVENLELVDVLTELADDLYYDCPLYEHKQTTDPRDMVWEKKYIYINYPEKKKVFPMDLVGQFPVSGKVLKERGFSFFQEERQYQMDAPDSNGIVRVYSKCREEGPDEDGYGAMEFFDWWMMDTNLEPIPGVKVFYNVAPPNLFGTNERDQWYEQYDLAVEILKNREN